MINKITQIENLKKIILNFKKKGKKVIHCHGVFDLLHIGHINHFKAAKELGDILVVTITSDQYVFKGPNRPAFNQQNRLEALAALNDIDYVALNNSPTAVIAINKLRKVQTQPTELEDLDIDEEDNFDKIYKGEISKSGAAILPSKRARKMPDKIFTAPKAENDEVKMDIKQTDEEVKDDSLTTKNKTE